MIIRQKRIWSLNHLATLARGSHFSIAVKEINRFPKHLEKFGFSINDNFGTKILPSSFNKYAKQNSEQYTTVDKIKPKEKYTQTVYWTRKQWAGRGETEEVTEFSDTIRERGFEEKNLFILESVIPNNAT